MAREKSPAKIDRNPRSGNEQIAGDNRNFVGPGSPVHEGTPAPVKCYQGGLPVSGDVSSRLRNAGTQVPAKAYEEGPDWGPSPEPSQPV